MAWKRLTYDDMRLYLANDELDKLQTASVGPQRRPAAAGGEERLYKQVQERVQQLHGRYLCALM